MLTRFLLEVRARGAVPYHFEVATLAEPGFHALQIRAAAVPIHFLGGPEPGLRGALQAVPQLRKLLRQRKYDLVHVHLMPAEVAAGLASLLDSSRVWIVGRHNAWSSRWRSPVFHLFNRTLMARFEKVVCVSREVERAVHRWMPYVRDKTVVVLNGVDLIDTRRRGVSEFDIISIGSMNDQRKGLDVLLRALSRLGDISFRAGIVGDGKVKEDLVRLCDELALTGKVTFLGQRADVPELLLRSRVFVLASRYEGMPNSVLEAMGAGLPVVATAVGGVPELIEDGVDGLLVAPEDPAALASALRNLLASPQLAQSIGRNAREIVRQQFSVAAHVDRLLTVYHESLGDHVSA